MKKSMGLSICGIVLVFMTLNVMSDKKTLYEKKEVFNSREEAVANFVGYMDSYEVLGAGTSYSNSHPKEFMESISLRYRIYIKNDSYRHVFGSILPLFEYSLEEVSDTYIKNRYEESFKLIDNYKRGEDITYYNLKGKGISLDKRLNKEYVKEDGTIDLDSIIDIKYHKIEEDREYYVDFYDNDYLIEDVNLYVIVVDEGQGYVVDYYERVY